MACVLIRDTGGEEVDREAGCFDVCCLSRDAEIDYGVIGTLAACWLGYLQPEKSKPNVIALAGDRHDKFIN
ncbi:hypothetical protein CDAR_366691 [Caerostris darwini]|uniref:Uncharacterized protein n=1 Tax=Caerostris darwini TaxID=1538125 RepID=A0AAV4Q3T5_9ARAC|nr:hypothetical protein CDAR_366691 [Caerostris darwini]